MKWYYFVPTIKTLTKIIHNYNKSSMKFHLEQLKKHCSICGKRFNKAKGRP